jgi:hypothetical protein
LGPAEVEAGWTSLAAEIGENYEIKMTGNVKMTRIVSFMMIFIVEIGQVI